MLSLCKLHSQYFFVGVTNCAGGKECIFPIDQEKRQRATPCVGAQCNASPQRLPADPQLGAAVSDRTVPDVDERSSHDWTHFQQWMADEQDTEPYPSEMDSEREPTEDGEHELRRFSETNPFGLPEGEADDPEERNTRHSGHTYRRVSSSHSAVSPSRGTAPSSVQAPPMASSNRKEASGNSAYGPLRATLAFSQPEKDDKISKVTPDCYFLFPPHLSIQIIRN